MPVDLNRLVETMARNVSFYEFEEARIEAGLFLAATFDELGVTERTYYRWKKSGYAPRWALRIVQLLSGNLAPFGWPDWYINNGYLFQKSLSIRYNFSPSELALVAYCGCPGHAEIRRMRYGKAANEARVVAGDLDKPSQGDNGRKRPAPLKSPALIDPARLYDR